MINRYHSRLSGPLLDRIDLHVQHKDLADPADAESSVAIRSWVKVARLLQRERLDKIGNDQFGQVACELSRV